MAEPTRLELAEETEKRAQDIADPNRPFLLIIAAALRSAEEEIASLTKELDAIATVLDVSRTSSRPLVCFVDDEVKANERAEEEIGRLNQYISQLEYSAASHQLLAEQAEAALAEMRRMVEEPNEELARELARAICRQQQIEEFGTAVELHVVECSHHFVQQANACLASLARHTANLTPPDAPPPALSAPSLDSVQE